jgi:hypothetical protein
MRYRFATTTPEGNRAGSVSLERNTGEVADEVRVGNSELMAVERGSPGGFTRGAGTVFRRYLLSGAGWSGEARLVGGIGEVLGLQAESRTVLVHHTALALDRPVQEVPGIELHAGLRGQDLHRAAAPGIGQPNRAPQPFARAADHEVVVVAAAALELLVVLGDAGADGGGLPEIEGRPAHGRQLSGGDERRVHRGEAVGLEGQLVGQDVAAGDAQIEVRMLGQVDRRRLVGWRSIRTSARPCR